MISSRLWRTFGQDIAGREQVREELVLGEDVVGTRLEAAEGGDGSGEETQLLEVDLTRDAVRIAFLDCHEVRELVL
jgi:hypothetical protein